MRRRLIAVAALASGPTLLLSGCLNLSAFLPAQPETTSTPTGEQVDAALQPFYSQTLVWSRCGDGMQCTTAQAPMNWDDPAQDTIELALVRQPVTGGTKLGSLLVNPGGPGGSGYDFILDSVDYATSERLQRSYDIVGFDPRGVGRSTPVTCYDDPAYLDHFLYDIVPGAGRQRRVDRRRRGRERRLRCAVPGVHGPRARVRRHGQCGPRSRSAARRARRREAELPRLLVRHVPRRHLCRPLPAEDRSPGARRRHRPRHHRLRCDGHPGEGLRQCARRLPGRLRHRRRLPVHLRAAGAHPHRAAVRPDGREPASGR